MKEFATDSTGSDTYNQSLVRTTSVANFLARVVASSATASHGFESQPVAPTAQKPQGITAGELKIVPLQDDLKQ
jgi:outer membrane protein OmpA-like peptidoglycan-associated protein